MTFFSWLSNKLAPQVQPEPVAAPVQGSEYINITGTKFEQKLPALQVEKMPLISLPAQPGSALYMHVVNDFVNKHRYFNDRPGHDIWRTPDKFFKDGGGDCEDFAIAKFYFLRDHHQVELVVAHDTREGIDHAVLLVDKEFVLDNRTSKIIPYTEFLQRYAVYYRADAGGVMKGE